MYDARNKIWVANKKGVGGVPLVPPVKKKKFFLKAVLVLCLVVSVAVLVGRVLTRNVDGTKLLTEALKDKDPKVRAHAAQVLGEIRDARAVDPLINLLKDEKAIVRSQAAASLGQIKDPKAVEPLIGSLKDSDPSVRRWSIWALGELNDAKAVKPLLELMKEDAFRSDAIAVLSKMSDAFDFLTEALKDNDHRIRVQAALALGVLKDPRAADPLIEALKDQDALVRSQAAASLGLIRDTKAVESLIQSLKDPQESVRKWSAWSLGELSDTQAVEPLLLLTTDQPLQQEAIVALAKLKDTHGVDVLTRALKSKNSVVRSQAAMVLDQLKDAKVPTSQPDGGVPGRQTS